MVTKVNGGAPRDRNAKQLPEYSLKIREVVKTYGPTQARFAKKIKRARVTVGRWVSGMREPGAEDYAALHQFAKEKSLASAAFFLEHAQRGNLSLEEKIKRNAALEHLEAIERDAAAGRPMAKCYLELAGREPAAVVKHLYGELERAKTTLSNGEFLLKAQEIFSLEAAVEHIWLGREVRAGRAAEAERRQNKRFLASQKQHSRAQSDYLAADTELFRSILTQISLFQDKLSFIGEQTGSVILLKERENILAECVEIASGLRMLGANPEYCDFRNRILDVLTDAATGLGGKHDPENLSAPLRSLQQGLSLKPPALVTKK
jgi:transcriptional regulator with XRE-family HTH domain